MPSYTGTTASETLTGSTGADTLTGLAGNDTYIVNNLGDVIVESNSADGNDTISTSVLDALSIYSIVPWANVENLTYSGSLAAQLLGNSLSNILRANSASSQADTLSGGNGNDSLYGYGGNDSLLGGNGNDWLDGGTGNDMMVGGLGNDTYVIDTAGDRVSESSTGGIDTIRSALLKDLRNSWTQQIEGLVYTGTLTSTLHGNELGNAVSSLSATNDTLYGYGGNDTLDGGSGADSLIGGLGNDLYKMGAGDVVVESIGEGTDTFQGTATDLSVTAYASTIENLFFTGITGSTLVGNSLANMISGGIGNDTLSGGIGNDSLFGSNGADNLQGGDGDDYLYGGGLGGLSMTAALLGDSSIDQLVGGAGNDRYQIDDTLDTVSELSGGGTLDVVISKIDNALTRYAYVEALVLQRGSSAWLAQGNSGSNVIVGNENDNYLVGGLGNDTLSGWINVANTTETQTDILEGGDGNDVLLAFDFVSSAKPREVGLFGGAGNDFYVLGSAPGNYSGLDSGGTDTAILASSGSIEAIDGVENVLLWGASASYDALALTAIDRAFSIANGWTLYAGNPGSAPNATGNDLANRITGNSLNNTLIGGAGNDTLVGAGGNDTLQGGTGIDSLIGGAGNDWYDIDSGDLASELAGGGFDILASRTISTSAGFSAYANFEGWQYLGSASINLNRGIGNNTADLLIGGSGDDTLAGYNGNDTLIGGSGNDSIVGAAGADSLAGEQGTDILYGGSENDALDGGDGTDQLFGEGGNDSLQGAAGNDAISGGDGQDTLLGGDGNDQIYGDNNEDLLVGGLGNDELFAGSGQSLTGPSTTSHGDHLWGDLQGGSGGGYADRFIIDTAGGENSISETFTGSGTFEFVNGTTIGDFEAGVDKLVINSQWVGNLDGVLDAPTEVVSAGGSFSANAELVLIRADIGETLLSNPTAIFDDIDASAVAAVIGSATASIATSQGALFVVDDGINSAVFLFMSNDGNATVTVDELYLLGVIAGQANLAASDIQLF